MLVCAGMHVQGCMCRESWHEFVFSSFQVSFDTFAQALASFAIAHSPIPPHIAAMAQVDHPSYWIFSDVGFIGDYRIVGWSGHKCHVILSGSEEDLEMEVVMSSAHPARIPPQGRFRTIIKDFSRRTATLQVPFSQNTAEIMMRITWLLDESPTEITK